MTVIINHTPRTTRQEIERLTELIDYNALRLTQGWWADDEKAAATRAWIEQMKAKRERLSEEFVVDLLSEADERMTAEDSLRYE